MAQIPPSARLINRRQTLGFLGAAAGLLLPDNCFAGGESLYASASLLADGGFAIALFDIDGREHLRVPLPARGHDIAVHRPEGLCVAFARQPDTFAVAFEVNGARLPQLFITPADRHFFGHGAFSADGRLLFATENDFEGERGVIGVYDVSAGFRRVGELPSGGVGPHEVLLMPQGNILAIANGGILTHPDYPRANLNLATMAPNLSYVSTETGEVVETVALPQGLHRLSIRHLAVAFDDSLWFGCQWEGEMAERPLLVGRHVRGHEPLLLPCPDSLLVGFDNYVGSVAASRDGSVIATSSPRGDSVTLWDAGTGEPRQQIAIQDVCGLAPVESGASLVATSGTGARLTLSAAGEAMSIIPSSELAWDNHLRMVTT